MSDEQRLGEQVARLTGVVDIVEAEATRLRSYNEQFSSQCRERHAKINSDISMLKTIGKIAKTVFTAVMAGIIGLAFYLYER